MGSQETQLIERVQDQLAMAEVDSLGIARGSSGIEQGSYRVFIEVGEVKEFSRCGEQGLIFPEYRQAGRLRFFVAKLDVSPDSGQRLSQ